MERRCILLESCKSMVKEFNLTRENAKEYFFMNQCRLMYIDQGEWGNADKFNSYRFDNDTLNNWTNEWIALKLSTASFPIDTNELFSIVNDLGYRFDCENTEKLISIYYKLQNVISDEEKINLLFRYDFSEVLNKRFYYGIIYITAKNRMIRHLDGLTEELTDMLKMKSQDIRKEYSMNLKKLYKAYGIKK